MYIPVLHARRSEKGAVINLALKLQAADNVRPLFIPVKDSKLGSGTGIKGAAETVSALSKQKIPYFFLTTPYVPNFPYSQADLLKVLADKDKNSMATPAVAVTASKSIAALKAEIRALGARTFAVYHIEPSARASELVQLLSLHEQSIVWHLFLLPSCDQAYCDNWRKARRALFHDGFVKAASNAAYGANPDQSFSKIGFQYKSKGFSGYGDFTICGADFKPGGGLAQAVAIHLTYPSPIAKPRSAYNEIRIQHFVSNNVTRATPEATRFLEALDKLIAFYQKHRTALTFSMACTEFEAIWKTRGYPRLGPVKRLSIQHHIELMSHLDL